jgi:hypothetical protein
MLISRSLTTIGILLAVAAMPVGLFAEQHQTLTKSELKALVASATTAPEHQRIADYYRAEASRLGAKAQEHEQQLAEYERNPSRYLGKFPTMGDHCRTLSTNYRTAFTKATAKVDEHELMARDAR